MTPATFDFRCEPGNGLPEPSEAVSCRPADSTEGPSSPSSSRRVGKAPSAAGPSGRSSFTATDGRPGAPLRQWASTFRLYAAPLMDMPVDRITSADVLRCLSPIWTSKPAAAGKARSRISAVFRWCIVRNHRSDNPVDRAVVALPRVNGPGPEHYRALPHREVRAALRAIGRSGGDRSPAALCCGGHASCPVPRRSCFRRGAERGR